jgi:hypothetical protein
MICHKCKKNLNTKYLGICEICKTAKWSRRFINSNSFEKDDYRSHITNILSNVDFIQNNHQKYFANYSGTFFANGKRSRTAYAILLNKSWQKKGIKYDYYIGGSGKHPAIRYLEHLIPQHESNLQRGNSMKLLDEFVVKEGSNDSIQYELERKLSIKYCKKGFYVYSDQHMCKKCREPKT